MRSGDLSFFLPSPQHVKQSHISLIKMTFSKAYGTLLHPFVEKYQLAKNEKGRNEVVKNAADAVTESKNLLEDEGDDLPKDLKTVRFFNSPTYSITYKVRPSLAISKASSRKKRLRRVGIQNPQNWSKFILSGTSSNRIIDLLLRQKFRTSLQIRTTLEVINAQLLQFSKTWPKKILKKLRKLSSYGTIKGHLQKFN